MTCGRTLFELGGGGDLRRQQNDYHAELGWGENKLVGERLGGTLHTFPKELLVVSS